MWLPNNVAALHRKLPPLAKVAAAMGTKTSHGSGDFPWPQSNSNRLAPSTGAAVAVGSSEMPCPG